MNISFSELDTQIYNAIDLSSAPCSCPRPVHVKRIPSNTYHRFFFSVLKQYGRKFYRSGPNIWWRDEEDCENHLVLLSFAQPQKFRCACRDIYKIFINKYSAKQPPHAVAALRGAFLIDETSANDDISIDCIAGELGEIGAKLFRWLSARIAHESFEFPVPICLRRSKTQPACYICTTEAGKHYDFFERRHIVTRTNNRSESIYHNFRWGEWFSVSTASDRYW